jgi:hypothetical protein
MSEAIVTDIKTGRAPTIEDNIIAKTEWTRFVDMPVGNTKAVRDMKEDMSVNGAGVYQIALKNDMPIDDFVQENIGYIGMGKDVFRRVVGIRTGKHTCGKMLKQMNVPLEDVMIRFLFTEEGKEGTLEQQLHKEMNAKFKYRFKWKKASGGTAGIGTQVMDMLEKIDNPAELIDIIGKAKERYTDIMLEAALSGEIKSVVDEYFGD